jgi:uncharacterized membrane protein YhaH (DUF805 family)
VAFVIQSTTPTLLLQSGGGGSAAVVLLLFVLAVAVVVATIAGRWKAFEKAGHPGWASLVPIFNVYLTFKIGGNSGWWMLGLFVPVVNFFVVGKMNVDAAKAFGKGVGFGLGLLFLPFVFWPLLGFGDDSYRQSGRTAVHEDWA